MPTLGELRALLDHTGKPICDSGGVTICGNCAPTICCPTPPCLRVSFLAVPAQSYGFNCPGGTTFNPGDAYYLCSQAYPDMADHGGYSAINIGIDALIPWVGAAGPWPHSPFNYFQEWQVNPDWIHRPEEMDAFGTHKNSRFSHLRLGDFHVMRASVQVYCYVGDVFDSQIYLDIIYQLRRMNYSALSDQAQHECRARIIVRSLFNWGPPPKCVPVFWEQYGQDLTHEGFNCSEDGKGKVVPQASAWALFDPFGDVTPVGYPGEPIIKRLALSWPCFHDLPITVQQYDCSAVIPPIGIGGPPDPTPDWAFACCPDRQVITSPLGASITGVGTVPPIFLPGCDECLNGFFPFQFTQDVGNGHVGFAGTFVYGAPCQADGYIEVVVVVYCADGVNWVAAAVFRGPGLPDIFIETDLIVAPCTDGYPENYFEVALNMNPGTNCFNGCPCFGGAYVIAGA